MITTVEYLNLTLFYELKIKISDIAKFLESPGKHQKNPATFPGFPGPIATLLKPVKTK